MLLDLTNKQWPPRGGFRGRFSRHDSYVSEGQIIALPLGFPGMVEPIPGDEAYVTALTVDGHQTVYGGTGGAKAHLFVTLTRGISGATVDLTVLQDEARTTAVMVGRSGRVFATTAPGPSRPDVDPCESGVPGQGAVFVHDAERNPADLIHEWHFHRTPAERVAEPLPDEGIAYAVLVAGPNGEEKLCGLGETSGTLFLCDTESGEVETVQPVDDHGRFSKTIVVGPDGMVYGTGGDGELWRFDPTAGNLDRTGLILPSVAGREKRNAADSFAVDHDCGIIYGGGTADGVLFAFDPAAMTIKSLGKVTCFRGIKACAVTCDGRLFGISGREGDIGHMFCYYPDRHELKDLGMVASVLAERVYGYQFSCSVVGRDGQIFLGEHDRGGHVWVYFPSVRRPEPVQE